MADALVCAIEGLRIDAVEVAHTLGKIALDGFDDDMVVVVHQAPRMADPVESLAGLGKYFQPSLTVGVIKKYILTPVATRSYVIKPAGQFKSKRSRHGGNVAWRNALMQDLTPFWTPFCRSASGVEQAGEGLAEVADGVASGVVEQNHSG